MAMRMIMSHGRTLRQSRSPDKAQLAAERKEIWQMKVVFILFPIMMSLLFPGEALNIASDL